MRSHSYEIDSEPPLCDSAAFFRGRVGDMVTQNDIARRLEVSQALVSRALAGTAGRIGASEATVRRIRELATRMDYRPSAAAQTLRGGLSRTVGVITKNFDDPFFGRLIAELRDAARQTHHSLVLAGYDPAEGDPSDALSLTRHRLDRLVLCGSDFPRNLVLPFIRGDTRVVQIGVSRPLSGVPLVRVDETDGFAQLVAHLAGLGHTRIGFLGTDSPPSHRRGGILRRILKDARLPIRNDWFVIVKASPAEGGYQAMKQMAERGRDGMPTALVAAEDVIAQGALRALHEAGLRVPYDMSIAGFDDIPSAAMMIPALTSVRQPIRELVRMAWTLLEPPAPPPSRLSGTAARRPLRRDRITASAHTVAQLPDSPTNEESVTRARVSAIPVKPALIVRESCGRPRSA